jgi:hypothetical protein
LLRVEHFRAARAGTALEDIRAIENIEWFWSSDHSLRTLVVGHRGAPWRETQLSAVKFSTSASFRIGGDDGSITVLPRGALQIP